MWRSEIKNAAREFYKLTLILNQQNTSELCFILIIQTIYKLNTQHIQIFDN